MAVSSGARGTEPPETSTARPPAAGRTGPRRMFIGGLPMNPATKAFAGASWTTAGSSSCWRAPSFKMAMRLPMVMASTWSWVT